MQGASRLERMVLRGPGPLFAEQGLLPLWEAAAKSGQIKTVSFDTLAGRARIHEGRATAGLVGQKYGGWGYDTVQMITTRW